MSTRIVRALAILAALHAGEAMAVACTSTANGNWNAPATWAGCVGGNGVPANTPGTADTVTIANTVTITVNASASAITNITGILRFNASPGVTLTVSGNVTV